MRPNSTPRPPRPPRPPCPVDGDRLFDALSSPRRRLVVHSLRDRASVHVSELAERVVRWERALPDAPSTDTADVYLQLYHCHVPKLVDAGLLEYDSPEKKVVSLAKSPPDEFTQSRPPESSDRE